jgi:hypothetical protein
LAIPFIFLRVCCFPQYAGARGIDPSLSAMREAQAGSAVALRRKLVETAFHAQLS